MLEVGYLGSVSHFLQRFRNSDNPIPGPGTTASRTPWPELGVMQFVDSDVNAVLRGHRHDHAAPE